MVDTPTQPHSRTRLVASLQCFARYSDDLAIGARQETPVAIHAISLERITMQRVADLRVGALVRLKLPTIGWRHVAITWLDDTKAGCDILLPLLPHELRTALNSEKGRRDDAPPQRKGKVLAIAPPRARRTRTQSHSHSPRGERSPLLPGIRIAGQAAIAALAHLILGTSRPALSVAR